MKSTRLILKCFNTLQKNISFNEKAVDKIFIDNKYHLDESLKQSEPVHLCV